MRIKILQNVRVLAIFLGLLAFAISCQDNATQTDINQKSQATEYQGILTNESDEPVEGAIITAEDDTQLLCFDTTLVDGTFKLENLPIDKSKITLRIFHSKFQNFKIKLIDLINSKDFEKLIKIRLRNNDSCCGKMIFYVKDSTDGSPVVGANVKVSFGNIPIEIKKTNEDGKVVFEHLCEGDYSLLIARDGYNVIKDEFHLGYCDVLEKTYQFLRDDDSVKCCASLKVIVRDDSSKQVIENAEVKLQGYKRDFIEVKKTNSDGIVTYENICEGKYWVRIAREHYKVVEEDLTFVDCEAKTLEIYLKKLEQNTDTCCDNKVAIKLKNINGELINGATVKIWKNGAIFNTKTTENGSVLFAELCTGKYGVSVSKDGYKPIEWDFSVSCGKSLEFAKTLEFLHKDSCCDNKVHIILKNKNGELLNGATVKLWLENRTVITKTTENGSVVFEELCARSYSISASKDGYKPIEWKFVVECDKPLEFVKIMELKSEDTCCDNKATFTTVDKDGVLIKGTTISIWRDNHKIDSKFAENGTAIFNELCSGKYPVTISKDGYKTVDWLLTVSCHQSQDYFITMTKNQTEPCDDAVIKIKVRNAEEQPLAGAKVIISDSVHTYDGYTNNEGYFVKEHLIAPATYTITISKDGFETLIFDWKLEHCDTYTKAVILR